MKKVIRFSLANLIISIFLSLACVLGYCAEHFGEIKFSSIWTYIVFVVGTAVSYIVINFLWLWFDRIVKRADNGREIKHTWLVSTIIIWALNFVVFLGVYPGFFCYDAQDELMETITRSFNNQHPMLHVLSMGGIAQAVHKFTDDYNLAVAAFILFQMTIIAIAFGYLVKVLKDEGLGRVGVILLSIYLGAFPVLTMYSLCSSKDGVFGAFLLCSVIQLGFFYKDPEKFWSEHRIRNIAILIISLTGMMLMRNNGVYAFAVYLIISIVYLFKRYGSNTEEGANRNRYVARFGTVGVVAIILYFVINTTLLNATNAASVGHREILTVPIQQVSRLYSFDKECLEQDEIDTLSRYIPTQAMKRYAPKCSDTVKIEFNEDEYLNDRFGFLGMWLKLGVKHPAAYINAWVMTSYGLYYPGALIDGYQDHEMFTYTYGDSSYFGYEAEPPAYREPILPVIDDVYRWLSLDVTAQKIPVASLLLSPGFMLWVFILLIGYKVSRSESNGIMEYILPLTVIATCLIGPISLVRYEFYLWVFVPMLMIRIFSSKPKMQ